jgi:hypothetical protein
MEMRSRSCRRLRTGRVGLVLASSTWGLAAVSALMPPSPGELIESLIRIGFVLGGLFFVGRGLFVGMYLKGDVLRIVSWFRSYSISRAEIRTLEDNDYEGMTTNNVGWSVFRVLSVVSTSGRARSYPGVMMTRRAALRVARSLKAWSGAELSLSDELIAYRARRAR